MRQREITLDCGTRQLMTARDEIRALRGVVAAEAVTGKCALRVWQGDELSEQALGDAVRRSGAARFTIR